LTSSRVIGNLTPVNRKSPRIKVQVVPWLEKLTIEPLENSLLMSENKLNIKLKAGEPIDIYSHPISSQKWRPKGLVLKESKDEAELRWFTETLLRDFKTLILREERVFALPGEEKGEREVFRKKIFLLVLPVSNIEEERRIKKELFTFGLTPREIDIRRPGKEKFMVKWGRFGIETDKEVVLDSPSGLFKMTIPVGRGFHWEHLEALYFKGPLVIFSTQNGVNVVQEIELEEYLASVIVSEMPKEAPPEALKAQAVAARGTALLNSLTHHPGAPYDVCATDHCQVYKGQGYVTESSRKAIRETWGEVLFFGDELADPRFATVCGGITEEFYNVWGGDRKEYLRSQPDRIEGEVDFCKIHGEEDAHTFIDIEPEVACNPTFGAKLDYLSYAHKLFRWQVNYERKELERIVFEKTGIDLGTLIDILPVRRGPSGRILALVLKGTKGDIRLLSELEIRYTLSESHLPSSNFYVEVEKESGIPKIFKIKGAGWGHGVGMCQVGAIHRALLGRTYRDILKFYYPGTRLVRLY